MPTQHRTTKLESVLGAFVFVVFIGLGIAALANWFLVRFNLGLELSGITKNALLYYLACMVMSTGLLKMSKAVRKVGIFMGVYPFGMLLILLIGFESLLANSAPVGNDLVRAGAQLALFNIVFVQGFIWLTPAAVTGYYFLKAYREAQASVPSSTPT
ncbi:hypothetical protein HBO38_36120 [Pseudomonas veronii]|uniref:Uncharacterized protein n=1 Tax=Pseudomonas veronii TaxID=76761 RepID=A0A7Y1ADP3_PSEVE|nr:hypothetical protein [Pseudomonas veronii]NMY13736.1 hypothetical protein [Pseudomonas veronii]